MLMRQKKSHNNQGKKKLQILHASGSKSPYPANQSVPRMLRHVTDQAHTCYLITYIHAYKRFPSRTQD